MKDKKESSDLFKVILGSIADGVFTVDSKRIITSFNCSAEKITGITESQPISRYCQDILHSDICEDCHIGRNFSSNHTPEIATIIKIILKISPGSVLNKN